MGRTKPILWDAGNRAHFREHGRCTEKQVEDVLTHRCFRSRFREQPQHGQKRIRVEGQACDRVFLTVVAQTNDVLRPITCFHPTDDRLRRYLAWRQSRP